MNLKFPTYLCIVLCPLFAGALSFTMDSPVRPLLEYTFNEEGVRAGSTGTLDVPLEFRSAKGSALIDSHSASGLGVSGLAGDYAFDNTSAVMGDTGNVARTAGDEDAIDGLVSFTFSGWFKTSGTNAFLGSMARLATDVASNNGWQILGNNSTSAPGLLAYVDTYSRAVTNGLGVLSQTNTWIFFAMTYDGTSTSNNLKIYAGDKTTGVALLSTQSCNSGALEDNTVPFTIGNVENRGRAFAGYIDNIRLHGTKTANDKSGALSIAQLENIRAGYNSDREICAAVENGVIFDETVNMWNDTRFPEYIFSYPPSLIFNCLTAGYSFVREPVVRRMPDGSLFCLHYTGGETEPSNENLMLGTSSTDDGETWSEARVLFEHSERGVYAPELFVAGGVPTVFLHTFSEISRYLEMRAYFSTSTNSGETWSEPVSVPGIPLATLIRSGIVLHDGTYLIPHYWSELLEDNNWNWTDRKADYYNRPDMRNWVEHCGVILSTNQGVTYTHYGNICATNLNTRLIEPAVVELDPNHVLMLIRAEWQSGFYKSESFDGGKTWSTAVPSGIPAIASKVVLLKHGTAVIMLFNSLPESQGGAGQHQARQRLSAWVSLDGCQTWTTKLDLALVRPDVEETWKAVCYPDAFIDAEQEVLYCSIDNYRQAFLIKIPLADLNLQ